MVWARSMQRELPEDLKEAVKLFAKSEKESNYFLQTRAFEDALDILNEHLGNYPDSPHESFIENIKLTYTRKFLEELDNLLGADIDTWFGCVHLLFKGKKQVEANIEKDAQLKRNYKRFMGVHAEEAIKILKQS